MRIADYFLQIEQQLKTALTTREIANKGLSGDHKFELMKLLSLVPAVSEVIAIDHAGIPQLHISRFRAILPGEELNYSQKASFLQAKQGVTYFSPVYFVGNAEPFITIAVAIERFPGSVIGVLQAETNLRYIGDVVKDIKVGKAGYAYIATRSGDVIAHPDNSLVLQRRNASDLDQLKAALRPTPTILKPETLTTRGLNGDHVLTSYAFLPSLDWAVILERPLAEAYEPLYGSLFRNSSLLLIGLGIALVASFFVVRRVVRPLEALRRGVERIGKGDLNYRLDIKTGDEIELLAEQFNNMAGELKDSYQILENKVKQRTEELSALFDITTAASQSLEINDVLAEVTKKIKETFHFDTTRIFLFTSSADELHLRAKFGDALEGRKVYPTGRGLLARATQGGEPIFFENIQMDEQYAELSHSHANKQAGYKALGYFPIRVAGTSLGCVVYNGRQARKLTSDEIRLLRSMCDQIGVAINNINLFEEVKEKTAQLSGTNLKLLESLDQQTRIGEVLRAMARSPSNLQALLDAMIMNAVTLAHANAGVIRLHDDAGMFPFVAYHRDNGPGLPNLLSRSLRIDEDSASTRSLRERKAVQILDIRNEGPHFRGQQQRRRNAIVGRQRRGQVLRPARQPVPRLRGPGRRRPLRPGVRSSLPDPVDVDPAVLPPTSSSHAGSTAPAVLREAVDAFAADAAVKYAFGAGLSASVVAVRESELELFDGESDETVAAAHAALAALTPRPKPDLPQDRDPLHRARGQQGRRGAVRPRRGP